MKSLMIVFAISAGLSCAAAEAQPVTRPDYKVYSPRNSQGSKSIESLRMRGDTYNDHFQVIYDEKRGLFYAFWTQATHEGAADHHIAFSKSTDKGKTWSSPVILAGSECRAYPRLAASWQQPMLSKSGRLYCLWNQQTASRQKSCTMLFGEMFGVYSDDAGETWEGLEQVPMERMDKDSTEPGVNPCWCNWQRPLRLGADGKFLVGCTRFGKAPYDRNSGSGVEFWQFENIDDNPAVGEIKISITAKNRAILPGVEEASIVKLPDGRLFAQMRSGKGSPLWSQSRDGGRTWSELKPLVDAEGKNIPHPMSPCPLYDWKGPEAGSGFYFTFAHMTFDNTKGPYQTRGPLYLLAGCFDPDGEQPIRFAAPKLFWSCKAGNSFYTSYTVVDGEGILWFPDRKYHLYGHKIGPEWFEGVKGNCTTASVVESVTGFGPPGNSADLFRNIANIGPDFSDGRIHERMVDIGFNTYSSLFELREIWDYATNGPTATAEEHLARCRAFLDRVAEDGFCVIDTLKSPHAQAFAQRYPRRCKDGSTDPAVFDASDPKARAMAVKEAEWIGRRLSHPALVGIEPANEVRFKSHLSFTPEVLAAWRAHAGRDVPPEVMVMDDPSARNPPHWSSIAGFPSDHVVPDDYPILDFYRWCWQEGDGWKGYCDEVLAAFCRGAGRDVRGMYSPALRTPALWNVLGGMGIARNWDYPNPEPYHLAGMVAQLQSVARETKRAVIASVQSISYRRDIAPLGIHPDNEPAWSREYPNCKYPTTPPDLLQEAFWSVLTRRIDGVATHGYDALVDESKLRTVPADYRFQSNVYRCTNPETAEVLKRLFHSVVMPLGPLLRAIPERDPQVAVFAGYASQILGSRITWNCKGRFYDACTLAIAANLSPYVINEEEVMTRGIPPSVRVLVLADCDVLTKTAFDRIAAFQAGGGLLVADANLLPALKADAVLPSVERAYAETVSDHDDGKQTSAADPRVRDAAVKRAAADLKAIARRKVCLPADTDNRDILVSVRSYGDADYVFPINDKRCAGDYVGQWNRVLEKGVPNAGKVTLDRPAGAVYDLVRHKPVPFESKDGKTVIPVSFETSDGKALLVVPKPLAPLSFDQKGTRVTVRTPDRGVLVPIRVDGFGSKPFYGVIRDGAWTHDFGSAPTGTVSVSNLADGRVGIGKTIL